MNSKQAAEVISEVQNLFNMNMEDKQIKAWAKILMQRGDYEKTMKNIEQRATDGNKFKPSISEIIIREINTGTLSVKEVDKTETHAYKKRNDEKYAKVISDMEKLRDKLRNEVSEDE